MNIQTFRTVLLPLAASFLLVTACSDDPTDPAPPADPVPPLWAEVDLGAAAGQSRVVAVDFTGVHGVALRLVIPGTPGTDGVHEFFRLEPDGSWVAYTPDTLRTGFFALDLAVDAAGGLVLAGVQVPGVPSVVADLRGGAPLYIERDTGGMFAVDGEGAFMVAGGMSGGGMPAGGLSGAGMSGGGELWTSTAAGTWNFDTLPLTGTNDSGFRDVYIRGDRAVACGFDDGADTLQVILTRTSSTGWEKIDVAGSFGRTFHSVALSDSGTIFVGGIAGAGGPDPAAFLSQRAPDGSWTDLILPDADELGGVMDILIAADGSIYLACEGEGEDTMANLVHADATGVRKEITPFPGGLIQMGQAAGGEIYAVGYRRESNGLETGVMLVKSP